MKCVLTCFTQRTSHPACLSQCLPVQSDSSIQTKFPHTCPRVHVHVFLYFSIKLSVREFTSFEQRFHIKFLAAGSYTQLTIIALTEESLFSLSLSLQKVSMAFMLFSKSWPVISLATDMVTGRTNVSGLAEDVWISFPCERQWSCGTCRRLSRGSILYHL